VKEERKKWSISDNRTRSVV